MSRRQYLSQTELSEFADITITDSTEANDRISQAEEIIDAYIGPQDQFLARRRVDVQGLVSAVNGATFTLEQRHQNVFQNNHFTFCEVEIVGGSGNGGKYTITGSTYEGIVTLGTTPNPVLDTTSFYRIYQLGKFPRTKDTYLDAIHQPIQFYKHIPEEVRRATAAQVQYMIEQGDDFFASDDIFKVQEQLGNYQYQKARDGSGSGLTQMISPKAKMYLQGFVNRKGVMIV